jgi:hypothetical protein
MHEADSFDRTEITPVDAQPDGAPDQPEAAKNPPRWISDGGSTGGASAIAFPLSNSETAKNAHFDEIDRKRQLASGTSLVALTIHMDIGDHLHEIKKIVPRGTFDDEVENRLGFRRQWRSELMRVSAKRTDIMAAIEWDKAANNSLRSEYSVKGALSLLREWEREVVNGGKSKTAKQKSYTNDFAPNKTFSNKADFIEFLKQLIYYLRADNEVLRRENAALQAELSRWNVTLYPDVPCPDQFALALPAGEVAGQ